MTRSYPATEYWKVFETSEVVVGGGATFVNNAELAQVVVTLYKHGVAAGTERMRASLYHDFAATKLYAASDWVTLDDVWTGDYWRGSEVPFDFDVPHIEAGQAYYIVFEMDGYTRNASTFFVALGFDWPLPFNDNAQALAMRFMVWEMIQP